MSFWGTTHVNHSTQVILGDTSYPNHNNVKVNQTRERLMHKKVENIAERNEEITNKWKGTSFSLIGWLNM